MAKTLLILFLFLSPAFGFSGNLFLDRIASEEQRLEEGLGEGCFRDFMRFYTSSRELENDTFWAHKSKLMQE